MRIALVMTGVSYGLSNNRIRDWRRTKDIMFRNVIEPLNENHNLSTYIVTNDNSTIRDIINSYAPQKYKIISYPKKIEPYVRPTILDMHIEGLRLLLYTNNWSPKVDVNFECTSSIDFVVMTRFDIMFFDKINTYNFNFEKFNIMTKESESLWESHRYTSDVLFAFPSKYLKLVIQAIEELTKNPYSAGEGHSSTHLHAIYNKIVPLIGEENIHFLHEGYHKTASNKFCSVLQEADNVYDVKDINGKLYFTLDK